MVKIYTCILCITMLLQGYVISAAAGSTKLNNLFVENLGQVKTEKGAPAGNVLFYKGGAMQLFVTTTGYSAVVKQSGKGKTTYNKIDFKLQGAKIAKDQVVFVKGTNPAINIYKPGNSLANLRGSNTVLVKNIYPGIDWLWSIDIKGHVSHDFMVHIGADASVIQYTVEGGDIANSAGIIRYSNKNFRLKEGPVVYKTREKDIAGQLTVSGSNVSFKLSDELKKGGFTIDPPLELDWSNGLDSANGTGFRSIVADDSLNTYTAGYSNDFTLPVFPQVNGSYTTEYPANTDAVIMKTDSNQNLVWATFFGGSNNDEANAIVATPTAIFVTGFSESWDFPVEPALNGNYDSLVALNGRDAFISKFNSVGKLEWSTGYGGKDSDEAQDIKYYNGNIYIAGYTRSKNFPVLSLAGAYNYHNDSLRNADGFILEFDTSGNRLWATCFGGSGNDYISSIFVDSSGIYTTGYSDSTETVKIPLQSYGSAYFDTNYHSVVSFVNRFSPGGALQWSTYFGDTAKNVASCILRNSCGVYICGKASHNGLPVLNAAGNYYQPTFGGGNSDGFIASFDPSVLSETYCTYYGDSGTEVLTKLASDTICNTIFTGFTNHTLPEANPTPYYFDQSANHGGYDGLMLGMDGNHNIFWSTLFGSAGNDFSYGLQFSNIYVVDMVGESFYNFGRDTIGGTWVSDEIPCPFVTSNGESNRFFNCELIGGGSGTGLPGGGGGGGGCNGGQLEFQSLIPLKTGCPNECNGWAKMDTANIGGCPPYGFLWSDGGQNLKDTALCNTYWGRVIDEGTGQTRTIYAKFDVLRVAPVASVSSNCTNIPLWDTIIKPAGGEPPYSIQFRGVSDFSCPTTAYFGISDSVGCVVSFSVPWYQYNINLMPFLSINGSCNLLANFNANTGNCVNTNYSQHWQYVIYSGTDTVVTPFNADDGVQIITNPTSSGYYTGYLDMVDCIVPLTGIFFYEKPNYTIRPIPDCANNNGSITVVVDADTAAISHFGRDSVHVVIFDSTGNASILNQVLIMTAAGSDSVVAINLPGHNYLVSVYNNSCDSTCKHIDLNAVNFKFNEPFVVCGDSTKLTAAVTNGIAPYSFSWSTGQTDSGFIYIDSASIYSLTVTDGAHCVAIASDTVRGTTGMKIDSLNPSNTECPYSDGNVIAAQVYVSGGAQPYQYLWSTGANTALASNLVPSANNTITVTDINQCSVTGSYFFSIPPQVQATDSSWKPLCPNNSYGLMNVYITNGFPGPNGTGYSVTWVGNQGYDTTVSAIQIGPGYYIASAALPPDYYSYSVSDYYGCTFTGSDSVKVPTQITYTLDTTNCLCFGDANGGAALTNIQSTISYTILWSNQQTGASITGLYAGSYSATLTDSNNCTYNASFYVSQPTRLTALIDSGLGIPCHNGTAIVNINGSGGVPPYADTGTYELNSGTYNFFIEDSNLCIATFSVHLLNPPPFTDSVWVTQPVCTNGYTATINAATTGGIAPYNLMVDSIFSQSFTGIGNVSAVPSGNASVVVSDAHGCSINSNLLVDSNFQAQGFVTAQNPLCAGQTTGSATITITAGQGPFNYNGNTFSSTCTVSNLDTGSYSFTVYDSLGCSTSYSVILTSPAILTAGDSITAPVLCYGNNATVLVTAQGGTQPYTGTGIFTYAAGTYPLTITDFNGCQANINMVVTQPASALSALIDTNISAICTTGGNNGVAHIAASGGTPPYNYIWSSGQQGVSSVSNFTGGYYTYTVTDSNLCQDTGSFTIAVQNGWQAIVDTANACNGNNGTAAVQIIHGGFIGFYGFQWFNSNNNIISAADTVSGLSPGAYSVIIADGNNCDTTIFFNIVQDTIGFTVTNDTAPGITCQGGWDNITVSATGGMPPYNGTGLYNFQAGINVVMVSDQTGCLVNDTINLWQPTQLFSTVAQTSTACSLSNGTILLTTTGGVPPYSVNAQVLYTYLDTVTITDTVGNYNLVVIDSLGCTQHISCVITQGNKLVGSLSAIDPTCNGFSNGQTVITMLNGYPPYQINGTAYDTTVIAFDSLAAGSTTYQVTDSIGCTTVFGVNLSQPGVLVIDSNLLQGPITCTGRNDAVVSVTAVGGTPSYIYTLYNFTNANSLSQSGNIFSGLSAGNYDVFVTDSLGCSDTLSLAIPGFFAGHDSLVVDSVNCYGNNDGEIQVYPIPADRSPYTYSLNGASPQVYNSFTGLTAGSYQIIVSDTNHCMDTLDVTINQPDSIDGRVWLNGRLLPIDSIILSNRTYANFTKLSNNPWTVTFSPNTAYTVYTDTLVQVQPRESLTYTVTIFMDSNEKYCFIQYTGLIDMLDIAELPNTITPNGDGYNDVWKIDPIKYPDASVIIFDRWGEIVFSSTNYTNDWGGVDQKSGKKLPDGTYFYLLTVPSQNNAVYKGDINIVDASH